jgi:predicted dienelactone hydrolase
VLIGALAACGGHDEPPSPVVEPTVVVPSEAAAYDGPGPYPVGVTELTNGPTPITVFYPARAGSDDGAVPATYDLRHWLPASEAAKVAGLPSFTMAAYSDLPPAAGDGTSFPLVLFSHGFAGYRLQSTFLTTHLASWGFVVAAVEHPYRNLSAVFGDLGSFVDSLGTDRSPDVAQLLAAIDIVRQASADSTSPLGGLAVDTDHIGAVGHSLGGFAVFAAARDPRIDSYVALAFPVGGTFVEPSTPTTVGGPPAPDKPSLLIAGGDDAIAPVPRVEAAYAGLPAPKRLAIVSGMTHLGFTDLCELTPTGTPDVLTTAERAGIAVPPILSAVFADGCDPSHAAATDVWPVLDELTTAHLEATLGGDPRALDFDEAALNAAFPELHVTLSESP